VAVFDPIPSIADDILQLTKGHLATDAIGALALALAVAMRSLHASQPADAIVLSVIDDIDSIAAHAAISSMLSRARES
jgi:hypothetical protein